MRRWFAGMGMGLMVGLAAVAPTEAESVTADNTVITSKTLSFDYKRYVAVFEGNVVVEDSAMRMESARLNVIFDGTNQIKTVGATGNVRITHEDKIATCDRAMYVARSGEVTLTGNAVLTRGEDSVMGEAITFWLNEDRMICTPGRLIIGPQDRTQSGGAMGRVMPSAGGTSKATAPAARQIRASTPPPAKRP
ncbi:MAG: hypothetical protein O3B24_02145 [Verrucomicrobia bacterium]|nr:hypothetical protein [Verrucomicrobiota bacterium]